MEIKKGFFISLNVPSGEEQVTKLYIVYAGDIDGAMSALESNDISIAGYHCTHDYDCCGHYYPKGVKLISQRKMTDKDIMYIFIQTFHLNV